MFDFRLWSYPHIILNSWNMFGGDVIILVEKRDWIMYVNVHNVQREFGWNATWVKCNQHCDVTAGRRLALPSVLSRVWTRPGTSTYFSRFFVWREKNLGEIFFSVKVIFISTRSQRMWIRCDSWSYKKLNKFFLTGCPRGSWCHRAGTAPSQKGLLRTLYPTRTRMINTLVFEKICADNVAWHWISPSRFHNVL
jgi:hypothetical protein